MNNLRNKQVLLKFGHHLRSIRLAKGFSQEELCFRAGLSKNQIGNIERGEVNVTLTSVVAIANALDMDISGLFADFVVNLPDLFLTEE